MKNFWESRTLFIKRVLAAGGRSGGGFRSLNVLVFFAGMKPLGEGSLYAAQIGGVGFHWFPGEGAVSCGNVILNRLVFFAVME